MDDRQLKKEYAFDQYGRYAIIRDIINVNRHNSKKFRILDIGGRGNILRRFLPDDEVFYLDPNVVTNDNNYIKGDGCCIPLKDNSFDFAVSADVFEHVSEEKRIAFLEENDRIARLGVILVAPFYSKEVYDAEINSNENFKILSAGSDHPWLKEHISNKLPREEEIVNFIKNKKYFYQKLHNNNLVLWEYLIGVSFHVTCNFLEEIKEEFYNFNYFYNTKVFPFDFSEPSYRKIYFIKKNNQLINLTVSVHQINDILFLEIIKKGITLVNKVNVKNKEIIEGKDVKIGNFEKVIAEKETLFQQLHNQMSSLEKELIQKNSQISFLENEITKKNSSIIHLNAKISSLENELISILLSKSWRYTRPIRKILRRLKQLKKNV